MKRVQLILASQHERLLVISDGFMALYTDAQMSEALEIMARVPLIGNVDDSGMRSELTIGRWT